VGKCAIFDRNRRLLQKRGVKFEIYHVPYTIRERLLAQRSALARDFCGYYNGSLGHADRPVSVPINSSDVERRTRGTQYRAELRTYARMYRFT